MKIKVVLFLGILLITSCYIGCSMESSYGEKLTAALVKSKQAERDLLKIDLDRWKELYIVTSDLKLKMINQHKDDTLSIELGVALDAILVANQRLYGLGVDKLNCKIANIQLAKRLNELLVDIQTGAGSRSSYYKHVTRELEETEKISSHAKILLERFAAAKQAIAQFKPVLDLYIAKK